VKLALTLLAKNEVDVIDANVSYHLNAGVDFIVATDIGSTDGTLEILERYERLGVLDGIEPCLAAPDELAQERRQAVDAVVGEVDGRVAERVVAAVAEAVG
jgi:hypothetical protein